MKITIETEELTVETLLKVVKEIRDPGSLAMFAQIPSSEVKNEVAKNINTSTETLSKLASGTYVDLKIKVEEGQNLVIDTVPINYDLDYEFLKRYLAGNPNTTQDLLLKFSDDKNPRVREAVAQNPNTPDIALSKLADDESITVREAVARNFNTPSEVLYKLAIDEAHDETYGIRTLVAANPNTDIKTLEILLTGTYYPRKTVAKNPNTPAFLLEKLAEDIYADVREVVASNPNTPKSILSKLAEDKDKDVRVAVAKNPYTPAEVLFALALEKTWYWDIKESVASNPNTNAETLEILSNINSYSVKSSVLSNPNVTVDILEKLAKDSDSSIRCQVARNTKTPLEILMVLSHDFNESVRADVAKAKIPDYLLVEMALSSYENVRAGVANNLNTPLGTLQFLSRDKSRYVRSIAIKRLQDMRCYP